MDDAYTFLRHHHRSNLLWAETRGGGAPLHMYDMGLGGVWLLGTVGSFWRTCPIYGETR